MYMRGFGGIARLRCRRGLSIWPAVGFLILFTLILLGVCWWYLLPAMDAYKHANAAQRRILSLHALLLMSALLVILGLILVLMFRVGRRLFGRPAGPAKPTPYVDAWAESAKRLQIPKE